MENSPSLTLDDLEIIRFPDALDSSFYHYQVSYSNWKYTGFGSDSERAKALSKAVSELIERFLFERYKADLGVSTTTGFAVHPAKPQAKEAAISERLERDALISHWLCKIPPYWIEKRDINPQNKQHLKCLNSMGFEVGVGILCKSNNRNCIVSFICGKKLNPKIGYVFSSSCHSNLEIAISSTFNELRRAATVVLNRVKRDRLFDSKSKRFDASHHFNHYLDSKNSNDLDWFLKSNSKIPTYDFDLKVMELKIPVAFQWPLYSFFCNGEGLQDFYFGPPRFRKINRGRLKSLKRVNSKLNRKLHVLP